MIGLNCKQIRQIIFGVSIIFSMDVLAALENIQIDKNTYVLVTAPQSFGDVVLSASKEDSVDAFSTVSFSWTKGLTEYMLISFEDCVSCIVTAAGREKVDHNEAISLEYELVQDRALISFFQALTAAGESFYLGQVNSSKEQEYFSNAIDQLVLALEKAPSTQWHLHAQTLLADTYQYTGNQKEQQKVLAEILDFTRNDNENPLYRIHALYEQALYETNVERQHELYDEGMELSLLLESEFLYAMGANYKAVILVREADYKQAFALLEKAKQTFEEAEHWRELMFPLHNLSWANQRAGNLPRSLKNAAEQRFYADRFVLADHQILGLLNFAMSYGQMGQLDQAEKFLDEAFTMFMEKGSDASLASYMGGALLEEKAQRLLEQGAFTYAADVADQSIRYFEETGYPERMMDALFLQSKIEIARTNFDIARTKLDKVIDYDRQNKRNRNLVLHLQWLAVLEAEAENFVEAAYVLKEAIELLTQNPDDDLLYPIMVESAVLFNKLASPQKALEILGRTSRVKANRNSLAERARFHFALALSQSNISQNESSLEEAILARTLIEEALDHIKRPDLRRSFLAQHREILDLNIQLLAELSKDSPEKSLLLAEAMRARTLKEKVRQLNQEVDEEYLHARSILFNRIQNLAQKWHHAGAENTDILRELRTISQNLERLELDHSEKDDNDGINSSVAHNTIEKVSMPDELLVYYFIGERKSWLWLIDSNGIDLYELPSRTQLEPLVKNYRASMDAPLAARAGQTAWTQRDAIDELSRVLIEPLVDKLKNPNITKLNIVPDDLLHSIPFSALTLSVEQNLVQRVDINIGVTSGIGSESENSFISDFQSVRVLAIADPAFSDNEDKLPYTSQEAKIIKKLFVDRATVLTGIDASKQNMLSQKLNEYGIFHFATHSRIDKVEHLLSGLQFSDISDSNSLWLAPEISSNNFEGKLIVLSSCESSFGNIVANEGTMSLTRSFMEAGASYIVGTLWPVEDSASAKLMEYFYQALSSDNFSPREALRHAQLKIQTVENARWSDPYYWAGFQLHTEN